MNKNSLSKSNRGGSRPGAGRPRAIPATLDTTKAREKISGATLQAIDVLIKLLKHKSSEQQFKAAKEILSRTLGVKKIVENRSFTFRINGKELD